MRKNIKTQFEEVINEIKEMYLKYGDKEVEADDDWCLYMKDEEISLMSECYILDYPEIDDDTDEEVLPQEAIENQMDIVYRPELLQDAIIAALHQKPNAANDELLHAIKYYIQHDNFMQM
ncbi:MAG: hypothetical protein NC337_07550 [Roseburia sp.]|nr:hypothetical protein [Roseburia sp.]